MHADLTFRKMTPAERTNGILVAAEKGRSVLVAASHDSGDVVTLTGDSKHTIQQQSIVDQAFRQADFRANTTIVFAADGGRAKAVGPGAIAIAQGPWARAHADGPWTVARASAESSFAQALSTASLPTAGLVFAQASDLGCEARASGHGPGASSQAVAEGEGSSATASADAGGSAGLIVRHGGMEAIHAAAGERQYQS